ncbi:hypothetical protein ACFQ68_08900 [Amycolatopsis japonica]|uniref:AbiJ-related protein n=1 Tax=Amycolatopsis japonica TaxID=208439 RepID=UPI00366E8A6E
MLDTELPRVAERVLATMALDARRRNDVQDTLWATTEQPSIPKRIRRELAKDIDIYDLICNEDHFASLLDALWVLDDNSLSAFIAGQRNLRDQIQQHVYRNMDWNATELFEKVGAFEASGRRFALFLEGLASADVVPDVEAQRRFVAATNPHLDRAGYELREIGDNDGYPVFSLVSTRSVRGRPKYLIFASTEKPDIRFIDALDGDIEILGNAEAVLSYDRHIGADGLLWKDLQAWWQDRHNLPTDEEAKRTLYSRLLECLPRNSPQQRNLFLGYNSVFGSRIPHLPALVPEVWLHWDPKTVQARGKDALLRFRMDFLLLLPGGRRVVLEVDGQRHYATNGRPDPALYATTMRADRELKLSGYEVFRFGTDELQPKEQARTVSENFFPDLFRSFGVAID